MTGKPPHNDDGQPIAAKLGRPGKPNMTETEFEQIKPVALRGRFTRGPPGMEHSLEAMAKVVSSMRGADRATDPRTRTARTVSGSWVARQLKRRGIAGKMGLRSKLLADQKNGDPNPNTVYSGYPGPRIPCSVSPEESSGDVAGVQQPETALPANDQEVAAGGKA